MHEKEQQVRKKNHYYVDVFESNDEGVQGAPDTQVDVVSN
jgi:hypothetical protein